MKVICPNCALKQKIRPDELMGLYYVCRHCGRIYRWNSLSADQQHQNEKRPPTKAGR